MTSKTCVAPEILSRVTTVIAAGRAFPAVVVCAAGVKTRARSSGMMS
jgi:hypothetical protein